MVPALEVVPEADAMVDTLTCSVIGCGFVTQAGFDNEGTLQQLSIHSSAAHPPPAPPREPRPFSKVDKHPRPEAKLDMTEHEFRFFQSEWSSYKRATGISGPALMDELWITMSTDLKKLAFDQGDKHTLDTEDKVMERVRSLAVLVL
jgi:hypothetical protein